MLGFRQSSLIGGAYIPVQVAGPIQTNEQTKTRQTTTTTKSDLSGHRYGRKKKKSNGRKSVLCF